MKHRVTVGMFIFLVICFSFSMIGMSATPDVVNVYGAPDFWDQFDGKIAAAFEKQTGIKVNYVKVTNNTDEYIQKASIAIASNADVDVMYVAQPIFMANFITRDMAVPLDKFAKKDKFDLQPFGKSIGNLRTLAKDKKLYGLPVNTSFWMLYYNKDLFDQAGVAYPKDDWTWDDFRTAAKELTKGQGADKIWGAYLHTWEMYWYGQALQNGIKWYANNSKATKLSSNKNLIKGLEMISNMAEVDKSTPGYGDNLASKRHYLGFFETGKVGMTFVGEWMIGSLREHQAKNLFNFKWDVSSLPVPKGVKPGTTWGNPAMLMIPRNSKNQANAWKYIKFYGSDAGQRIVAQYRLPARMGDYADIFLAERPGFSSSPGHARAVLNNPQATVLFEKVAGPKCADYQRIIAEEGQLALVGSKTPKEAMASAEKRINNILAQP